MPDGQLSRIKSMASVKGACAVCGEVKWTYARGLCRICHPKHWHRFPPKNPPKFPRVSWTDERLAMLQAFVEVVGLAYSDAAAEMGVTKNAIAGACWRNAIKTKPFTTTEQRLGALKAALDEAMALPVTRVPNGEEP